MAIRIVRSRDKANFWLVLKRLDIDSWIHSTMSTEAKNRDGIIQQRSVRTLISILNQSDIYGRPTKFLSNSFSLAWKGPRQDRMRDCQTTNVLQARKRMMKLQTWATLQYKRSFSEHNFRYRGRGPSRGTEAEVGIETWSMGQEARTADLQDRVLK